MSDELTPEENDQGTPARRAGAWLCMIGVVALAGLAAGIGVGCG